MNTYIFDIDHTLLKGATGLYFIREGLKKGYFSYGQLLRVPVVMLKYRMGFLSGNIANKSIPFMTGLSREIVEQIGWDSFEKYARHVVYSKGFEIIRDLQARGERVILATSSFNYSVKPVAQYFGIETLIASSFEFEEGICTGFIAGRSAFGDSKRDKVLEYLEKEGISPEDCTFYSDSYHDLPLLETVGAAICVNPDQRLKRRAKSEGWEILKFKAVL